MPPGLGRSLVVIAILLAAGLSAADPAAAKEFLSNGTMDAGKDGKPVGWGGRWELDPPNPYLRLAGGAGRSSATRILAISGERALRLGWRVRHADLEHDPAAGKVAEIGIDFLDATGQAVLPGPSYPSYVGSSAGWTKGGACFFVPQSAVSLRFRPTLAGQRGGTLDVDQVTLEVVNPADVPVEARTQGRVAVDGGTAPPPALRAEGGRVVAGGREVWLQGLVLDEVDPTAFDRALSGLATAVEIWKANVVRLPVERDRWLAQDAAGSAYRSAIVDLVRAAGTRGAWVIVDLRRHRAPDEVDVRFWKDAAARLKDQEAAVFALFHAPHDLGWPAWRNGGDLPAAAAGGPDVLPESSEPLRAVRSVGLQALVDAVRGTGARNALLVGGIDWASELPPAGDAQLDDHGGNGIIWDVHVVPWRSGWQRMLAERGSGRAVIVGQVEGMVEAPAGIPADRLATPWTWVPDTIGHLQAGHWGWIAATYAAAGRSPILLGGDAAVPTPYWGAFVRAALLGRTFVPVGK